jgi:hypothetical protein
LKSYVTKDELRGFADKISSRDRVKLRENSERRSPLNATFLSHSTKDDDGIVLGAVSILKNHGAHVYLDKIDPNMPPYTSAKTAELLKTRINQSKRFVVLATENSKSSKWVPWELGIADGFKGMNPVAIFPAVENWHQTDWTHWEYLGLYQRIIWGTIEKSEAQWIALNEEENTAIPLRRWLEAS